MTSSQADLHAKTLASLETELELQESDRPYELKCSESSTRQDLSSWSGKMSKELSTQADLSTYAELFTHSDPYCEKFLQISMCN